MSSIVWDVFFHANSWFFCFPQKASNFFRNFRGKKKNVRQQNSLHHEEHSNKNKIEDVIASSMELFHSLKVFSWKQKMKQLSILKTKNKQKKQQSGRKLKITFPGTKLSPLFLLFCFSFFLYSDPIQKKKKRKNFAKFHLVFGNLLFSPGSETFKKTSVTNLSNFGTNVFFFFLPKRIHMVLSLHDTPSLEFTTDTPLPRNLGKTRGGGVLSVKFFFIKKNLRKIFRHFALDEKEGYLSEFKWFLHFLML